MDSQNKEVAPRIGGKPLKNSPNFPMNSEENFDSTLARRCQEILQGALKEIRDIHPEDEPPSLCCQITLELLKDPVITPGGFVYERINIIKWLQTFKEGAIPTDPGNRQPLSEESIKPFPQLLKLKSHFLGKQARYELMKEQLILEAEKVIKAGMANEPITEIPCLFKCPISKQKIIEPFVTPAGKIYDKAALLQNDYKDENGQLLDRTQCRYFEEFQHYLKAYELFEERGDYSYLLASAQENERVSFRQ